MIWADRIKTFLHPYQERMGVIWHALSMRGKLSVLITGLILVTTAFFYSFAVIETTREIKIGAINKGEAIAEALKGEVTYSIISGNFPGLNLTFRRLASTKNDIAYIFLVDPTGEVLAHSETELVGARLTDRMTQQSLTANSFRVQFQRVDLEGQGVYTDLCDLTVPIFITGKKAAVLRIGVSLTDYLLSNGPRIRHSMALFMLPLAFIAILIAIRISESFTRPLQRLAQAVSEVSRGNYDIQLPLNRRDELGEVAQAFNVMAQHLKENFAKVSDMANRDGLTGLYNARYFHETLTRQLQEVARTRHPLSILIFDGDRFKRVNDRYGHPMGDQILQHLSRIARSLLRGYDVLARYGGEEFIVMLTETTGEQALKLGERLRQMTEQRPFITESGEIIKITISIGVAEARPPYDRQTVISQADQALYRAKETGRNKVVLFQPKPAVSPSMKVVS